MIAIGKFINHERSRPMDITDEMKRTLQTGIAKKPIVEARASEKTSGWRMEFWRPLDVALHFGTPKPSIGPVGPVSAYNSRTFID